LNSNSFTHSRRHGPEPLLRDGLARNLPVIWG
jgi:hypothetical protein